MGINSGFKGLKYSVLIFVEKIYKMQYLEGSGMPVLYIGRTVLKGKQNIKNKTKNNSNIWKFLEEAQSYSQII